MVENKDDLGNAIALNSTMVNGARLLGPSIAGMLIAVAGEGTCFLINGLSFLVVVFSLLRMRVVPKTKSTKKKHVFTELKEGFSYTFGFAPIKFVIMLLALISLMGMPYVVLMPVFSKEILHGGAHTFGFLIGASGLGALAGAVFLASRKNALGLERIIPLSAGLFGFGLVAFSLSRFMGLSILLMVITGLGMMLQMASSNTIIQTIVDDDKRGRVMSIYAMAFMGTAPFGSLLAGGLAKILGAPLTLAIGGVACLLGALIFARKLPVLREKIRPTYIRMGIIPEVYTGIQQASDLTIPPEE
jgi:MFS family permease